MEKPLTKIITSPELRKRLEDRYWPKVDKRGVNDCWNWAAKAKHPYGYGRMTAGRGVNLKAHQIGWALTNGPIPTGMMVCHSCDNTSCSNPAHLFLGSQVENMQDAKRKGRTSKPPVHLGSNHHNAKRSENDIAAISADRRAAHRVAKDYGVCEMTIYRVRKGNARVDT